MIVVTLLSIHIKKTKVDHGVFDKEEFKNILQKSKLISVFDNRIMFDLRPQCDLNIQYLQSLTTGHANVQIPVSVGRSYAFFNERD